MSTTRAADDARSVLTLSTAEAGLPAGASTARETRQLDEGAHAGNRVSPMILRVHLPHAVLEAARRVDVQEPHPARLRRHFEPVPHPRRRRDERPRPGAEG